MRFFIPLFMFLLLSPNFSHAKKKKVDQFQIHVTGVDSLMCFDTNECHIIPKKEFDKNLNWGKKCRKNHIRIDMTKPGGKALFDMALNAYNKNKQLQIHVYNGECDNELLKVRRLRFL